MAEQPEPDQTGGTAGTPASGGAAGGSPLCSDNRTVCCDTLTGESSPPTCDFGQHVSCSGGLVKLRDIECRVMPELVCPSTSEELGDTCPLEGAVCDYPLGCGQQQECRCQSSVPGSPGDTNVWVCSFAICAK